MATYEAVIRVRRDDPPAQRAADIAEGIAYACALLHDEYEWSADEIAGVLDRASDGVYDSDG